MTSLNSPAWLGNSDPARREAFERAITVAGAGSVLLQTYINRVVQQLTLREFGVLSTLDRRAGSGNASYINRRASGATGGAWVADTDALTNETGTYTQSSFTYRTLATRGSATRKIQATGASYGDILATSISSKAEDFSNALESALLIGDTNITAASINGLLTQINGVAAQTVALTTSAGGDVLTLAALDQAIDLVKGSASRSDLMIVGSFTGLRKVNNLLQAQQRFVDTVEVGAGFRVRSYDGIPLITSTGMPDTLVLNASGYINDYSGGGTTALAIINKRYMWIEELTPTTVMPLAKTDSQFDQFDMFWDGTLVWANTNGSSLITAITAT